ncbi:MAG: response regulator [Promethearchaeota archaeon]
MNGKKKKICIIEDDSKFLELYLAIFNQIEDIDVIHSEDGNKGLNLILSTNPDIIILDYVLPVLNGVKICKKLRNIENFKKKPIIIISSSPIKGDKEKIFREAGFDRWFEKPLNIQEFKEIISELL